MKKHLLLAIGLPFLVLVITFGIYRHYKSRPVFKEAPVLKTTTLINTLPKQDFSIKLFFGNLMDEDYLHTYSVSPNGILLENAAYTSYTEGFIEEDKHTMLLELVNAYRSYHREEPIAFYYSYDEVGNYGFLSLADDINTLYIINLSTKEVLMPHLESPLADKPQNIYHITRGTEAFYILSYNEKDHLAYLYTLEPDTFKLIGAKPILSTVSGSGKDKFALDTKGNVYFISGSQAILQTQEEVFHIPLTFTPDHIYYDRASSHLYILCTSDFFLTYNVLDDSLEPIAQGQANLPNKMVHLTDCMLKGHYLYTVCNDTERAMYRQFVTIYDINTREMVYCLGIKALKDYTMLGSSIS